VSRRAWSLLAVAMFVLPLAFGLARAPSFSSTATLHPRPVGPYPPIFDVRYYRKLTRDSRLQQGMRAAGARSTVYSGARIREPVPSEVTVTVDAPTPSQARDFALRLADELAAATRRQLGEQALADTQRLGSRHGAVRRWIGVTLRLAASPSARVSVGAPPATERPTGWADRLVDALPGDFPARPNPLWAGLAGVLLVALARVLAVAVLDSGRLRAGRLPPL
jgi:hypothetical protein